MSLFDDFASVRTVRRLEYVLLIILGLLLFGGLNYWASRSYQRIDITPQQQYSLSPQTLAYIGQIEKPISLFFIFSKEDAESAGVQSFDEIRRLLKAYADIGRNAGAAAIEVDFVDVFRQRKKTQDLVDRYGLQEENLILIVSGDRRLQIPAVDLYDFEGNSKKAFRGEAVVTAAILDVAYSSNRKIYFITGHGEMRLDDVDPLRGLSQGALFLAEHNFEAVSLDLSEHTQVPEDAALVVLASPQLALLPEEVEKLRKYMSEHNGRLLLMLDPGREHGLDSLLYDWGLRTEDARIIDMRSDSRTADQAIILRDFLQHPVTQYHIDNQYTILVGPSRPVSLEDSVAVQEQLILTPLIRTSDRSWGERAYHLSDKPAFDPAIDLPGPLSLAVAAERQVSSQLGIKISGGRMVVVGNANFVANRYIHKLGNRIFFLNLINWGVDQKNLLNLPPRPIEYFHITLSRHDIWRLGILILTGFPAAIALFGFIVISLRYRH